MARGNELVAGVTIEAGVLARAMKHAAAIVETRNTIPILANVRLTADGDTLEVVTSDLDVEFRQRLPMRAGGSLATTVDARRLAALAGAVDGGAGIALEMDGPRLAVKSGRSRWLLPTLPVTDFPAMPFEADGMAQASVEPASGLASALGRTVWACFVGDARPGLTGPMMHGEEGCLAFVATDGNVLARVVTKASHPQDAPEAILGPKFARVLQSLTTDAAGVVSLAWDERKVRATFGDVSLTGKLIDQQYPDYRKAIPGEGEHAVTDPAILRDALRRVVLVASEKTRLVKLEREADKMVLSLASAEGGEAREELPADTAPGETKGFNARYLEQMLDAIGGDSIEIHPGEKWALMRRVVPDGALGVIGSMSI